MFIVVTIHYAYKQPMGAKYGGPLYMYVAVFVITPFLLKC